MPAWPYRRALLALGVVAATAPSLGAQLPAALDSQLKQIFASNHFGPRERFGPAVWIEQGAAYTTLERSRDLAQGSDIVRYATATGARSVYVPASKLTPPGATAPLEIDDYSLSPDGGKVLLFTNTARVWRQNTRGDYWVFDRASGRLSKLGGGAPASTLMYAKFSPAGDRVAYVRQGELFVESLADGRLVQLSSGADSLHVNGMTDWVYEEEFGLRDGFRWSPDGRRIAYWQFDMTGVGTFTLINSTDSLYPFLIPIQYPKVGTTNSAVRAGVVSADGGGTTWLALPGDPREDYLPRMEWAGPNELVFQRINRLQNRNVVHLADASTGATRAVLVEQDSAWVDVVDDFTWLKGGAEFLWTSERDGWRHVYRVSRDDRNTSLVTTGVHDAMTVAGLDEQNGWLYYTASPDNATQSYLYRTRLDGKGPALRTSPASEPGWHGYDIAPNGKWAFSTYSTANTPPIVRLVALPQHTVVRTLVNDTALRTAVAAALPRPVEFVRVPIEAGVVLDAWMMKPKNFDPTRRYPVLMHVYGEPAGQTVTDRWGGASTLWYQAVADQGYVVASVDNRGTPAPRGRAWRKSVYQQIGVLSSADQAAAVRSLTKTYSFLDPARVAIWGWSGGGSSTLQAMFRYPDVYQLGMSVAPVPDQLLYDTIYQERYMGLPSVNPEAYQRASPIHFAEGLKGRLLVVHGSGDDNVHYQGTERLVSRLVELGKSFDFMAYPNRSHCICEGPGTTLHVHSLLTRFLVEHLPAGPRQLP